MKIESIKGTQYSDRKGWSGPLPAETHRAQRREKRGRAAWTTERQRQKKSAETVLQVQGRRLESKTRGALIWTGRTFTAQ
jgi:hypothetical protein